ncbi:MAG TPA: ATPase, T2SS/T4P/T4SS family [Methylocella sp.]|nr:ATPase, T2SS/T4P/T4SS family [Methylocella sp.]
MLMEASTLTIAGGREDAQAFDPRGMRWVVDPRKSAPGLDALLLHAYSRGASRIDFQTGQPVWLRIHGRNERVGRDSLDEAELADITNHMYGADGLARLQGGGSINVRYEIVLSRTARVRYRVNGVPIETNRGVGVNLILRPIPDSPPSLEQQLVEPEIMDSFEISKGMVIVSGATGSGKSTLISGMTVAKLENPNGDYNIVEAGAPLEFRLDRPRNTSSTIAQSEVPRDFRTFGSFIEECMRREPTDIIVGECRNVETMEASIQAAISGHALTTTIHAKDVASTMDRIVYLTSPGERQNALKCVLESMRLVINQRLARSTDGKRTPLREFLIFNSSTRDRLSRATPEEWTQVTKQCVEEQGQSFRRAIEKAFQAGRISEQTAAHELREIE